MTPRFEGIIVPTITPFRDGQFDKDGLRRVVRHLLDKGVDGLVPTGTTGESPTLTDAEKVAVWETTVEEAGGQVPVIAGTGTCDTRHTIELSRRAEQAGVDGLLVVAPYYNKPSQDGLFQHFAAVASATALPVLLYNIPGRTSVNIDASTIIALSELDNIVGVKEAGGDLNQVMDVIHGTDGFAVLSGEDHLIFTTTCLGGHGAIAASAHIAPGTFKQMYALVQQGRLDEAREIHYRLLPLVRTLFSAPNPVPLKGAYELLQLCSGETRLPLVPATQDLLDRLDLLLVAVDDAASPA